MHINALRLVSAGSVDPLEELDRIAFGIADLELDRAAFERGPVLPFVREAAVGHLEQLAGAGFVDLPFLDVRDLRGLGLGRHVKSPMFLVMVGCHRQAAGTTPRRRPEAFRHQVAAGSSAPNSRCRTRQAWPVRAACWIAS